MTGRGREHRILIWFVGLLGWKSAGVNAGIYVNSLFRSYEFPSVNYFDLSDTQWPYYDEVLNGRVVVLPSLDIDQVFPERNATTENATIPPPSSHFDILDDDVELDRWKDAPKFLVVDFGFGPFEAAMHNTSRAAEKLGADFVVLVVSANVTWQEKLAFWWSHRFPGSTTKGLLPGGNATHQYFFMAVGPGEGAEIRALIARETRFFGNYTQYEEFYFGIDNIDAIQGRDFVLRFYLYMVMVLFVSRHLGNGNQNNSDQQSPEEGNNRSSYIQFTGEDLGMGEIQSTSDLQDCPVCLETMQPGERVRILPCRHVLHHDCITGWFEHGKYSCPLCKMDLQSHLEEQRSASLSIVGVSTVRRGWRMWPFGRRRIENLDAEDQLIFSGGPDDDSQPTNNDDDVGDLELTEEIRNIT